MSVNLTIAAAQQEMRTAYLDGAPGLLVSGCAWGIAAATALLAGPHTAIWTLLGCGTLIFPLSVVLTRALGRPARHARDNPFGSLAMASTVWMILGLILAYGVGLQRPDLFFPAALFTIGGRYLIFATVYGMRIYWVCGIALALAGYGLAVAGAPAAAGALAGAVIEIAFALVIFAGSARRNPAPGVS